MTITSTTATAISTATASSPSIATTAAGAGFSKLLPLQAVVTVLAATVAGGEVIASRSVSTVCIPYERVRIRHLT